MFKSKSLITYDADEWLLWRMSQQMAFEVLRLSESLVASFADIWSFPCMYSPMDSQRAFNCETSRTYFTNVLLEATTSAVYSSHCGIILHFNSDMIYLLVLYYRNLCGWRTIMDFGNNNFVIGHINQFRNIAHRLYHRIHCIYLFRKISWIILCRLSWKTIRLPVSKKKSNSVNVPR